VLTTLPARELAPVAYGMERRQGKEEDERISHDSVCVMITDALFGFAYRNKRLLLQ
jgi:hypothetical protein